VNVLLAAHTPLAVDLNAPGGYLNWSIFTISEGNLVLVAVMVAIFGIEPAVNRAERPMRSGRPAVTPARGSAEH